MTNIIGAQLTGLSAPGYGYGGFGPYGYGGFRPYGVFFGAETPPPGASAPVAPPKDLTTEVGPILAPATRGIVVNKHLDEKQVLHVEICVDGKCHRTSMDLAPAIAMLMQKLAKWHDAQHAQLPPPSTVVSTVQAAVGAAEDLIVGALVSRHIDTVAAGILGDIAGAVKGAVSGIAGGVASTFKKLKGPIGAAAGVAAAAGVMAIPGIGPIIGPIAAPMAAKLANDLVQSTAGDSNAQKKVAEAAKQAKTDPAVAIALEQATKAVANSTAAHHIQDTAKKAAQGDNAAQQQIVKVADDAQKGDPQAKAVADLVANAMKSEWGAKLWEQVTGRGPGTVSGQWVDLVGADPQNPSMDPALKQAVYAFFRQPFFRPLISQSFWWTNRAYPLFTAFRDWQFSQSQFGQDRNAYFRAELARLQSEVQGLGFQPSTQASGWYDINVGQWYDVNDAYVGQWYDVNDAYVGQWYDVIGATVDQNRELAKAHAITKPGNAAGVLITLDGKLHGRGFHKLDDAIDWLQHITRNRSAFTYAAAYQKYADGDAAVQAEEFYQAPREAPTQSIIPRDAPATTGWWY